MPTRDVDPRKLIPSAATLRQKLDEALDRVRRLRVLLATAERIERSAAMVPSNTARRQEGAA